ncbi:MAG: cytochrome C [Nitrospinae bacterium CG11_big_fil_rev_8_21_14_0_20_45_15]|nr:MAG: cytochrome C [Nitrospinae bacterium CG11_big_fil_rev_8_21_14_0_20_45_15]
MKQKAIIFLFTLLLPIGAQAHAETSQIAYPEGYRHWTHIKSMLIEPGHPLENPFQGLHHVYGNDKAMNGLKSGNYPEGSVLVFDLLNYKQGGQTIQEGARKLVGVMVKDSNSFKSTGGWGFEGFAGDSKAQRLAGDGGQSCYACHASQETSGYVFSKMRK